MSNDHVMIFLATVIYQVNSEVQRLTMPGPDAQNLMLGTWLVKVKYPPSSDKPNGDTAEGTEIWRPGPGGRSVIEEYREKNSKGEVEGLGVAWWDKDAQGQRFVWCENDLPSACYVSKSVAKWEGDSLVWKEEQEMGGGREIGFRLGERAEHKPLRHRWLLCPESP